MLSTICLTIISIAFIQAQTLNREVPENFVYIEGGTFMRGNPEGDKGEAYSNVCEWCWDKYPTFGDFEYHLRRGRSWVSKKQFLHSASRNLRSPITSITQLDFD